MLPRAVLMPLRQQLLALLLVLLLLLLPLLPTSVAVCIRRALLSSRIQTGSGRQRSSGQRAGAKRGKE